MVYRKLVFTALGGWLTVSAYAQPASQSTEDSIRLFTDTVLSLVEGHSLYTDKLNWSTYRTAFTKEVYEGFQEAGGLQVPQIASFYGWNDGQLGEKAGTIRFENVSFSQEAPAAAMFEEPEDKQN